MSRIPRLVDSWVRARAVPGNLRRGGLRSASASVRSGKIAHVFDIPPQPIPNPQALADRRHVLTRLGVPWMDWSPGKDVVNPSAFGRLV